MTYQALNPSGSPDEARFALVPSTGFTGDIIELVMADHRRIRRLCAALQDAARHPGDPDPGWTPVHLWQRLADLLIAHFEAEEEICHLSMVRFVTRAAQRLRETVADHDDIRGAVEEASLQLAGSTPWWRTVRAAVAASVEHLDREESDVLADCLPRLTWSQRMMLGHQWSAFIAARTQDSVHQPCASPWHTPIP
jgi:hypothetical protein